jgi:hypothetical protein
MDPVAGELSRQLAVGQVMADGTYDAGAYAARMEERVAWET